jgi:hypothetical protein
MTTEKKEMMKLVTITSLTNRVIPHRKMKWKIKKFKTQKMMMKMMNRVNQSMEEYLLSKDLFLHNQTKKELHLLS